MEQKDSLSPGSIDFLPLYCAAGSPAKPEATDRPKGAIPRNIEQAVQHIGGLQALELLLRTLNLEGGRHLNGLKHLVLVMLIMLCDLALWQGS